MARVTVEDCLDNVENRFELVMLATKRSRQLALGMDDPKLPWENDKPTVVALREIAANLVNKKTIKEAEERRTLGEEVVIFTEVAQNNKGAIEDDF